MKCPKCQSELIELKTYKNGFGCRECLKIFYYPQDFPQELVQNQKSEEISQDISILKPQKELSDKNIVKQIEVELLIKSGYRKSSIDLESYDEESDYSPDFDDD